MRGRCRSQKQPDLDAILQWVASASQQPCHTRTGCGQVKPEQEFGSSDLPDAVDGLKPLIDRRRVGRHITATEVAASSQPVLSTQKLTLAKA
jgi:hypothetical protein